ncbi:AAA family ATPase [Candidatus Phytoplasma australiense]|nr:AAA family ATPase [Candidatus Phytoplasma australiense]
MILIISFILFISFLEIFYFIQEKSQLKGSFLINFYTLIDKIKEKQIEKIHYTYKKNSNFLFKEYYLIQAQGYSNNKYYCYVSNYLYEIFLKNINSYKDFLPKVTSDTKTNYLESFFRFIFFSSSFIFMFYIMIQIKNQFLQTQNDLKKKIYQNNSKITFQDIAGLDKEKKEIYELVDFLKNPTKYKNLGINIPKGVLLYGPPGTGKTLLAKALANELEFPFYFFSGSEFVEMYVGLGAARIRNMFQEVKKNTPCVLFIDEIDALGMKRGTGFVTSGSHEKDQTLNQLLVEMDGFETLNKVIVFAATNRADILDPALLRPGRFDRKFKINLPDIKAREAILKLHAKNKKINNNDLEEIAKITEGATGAQLAAILNEASILAIRDKKELIDFETLKKAINRIALGITEFSQK